MPPQRRVILTDRPPEGDIVERIDASIGGDPVKTEVQTLVTEMIEEAIQWREEHLEPEQETATDFYMARKFGNEEEGRSQVVMTDVRDAVKSILPSLMRIFFGPEKAVEYEPREPEDVAGAEQATDYVNLIVQEDNPGFIEIHSAFKDALVRKMGIIKWWWEDDETVEQEKYTGLFADQVALLMDDEELEIDVTGDTEADPEDPESQAEFNVTVTRRTDAGMQHIAAVPNDEFIFSPNARSLEDSRLVGQEREVRADELIAMGVPEEMVERHRGKPRTSQTTEDALESARRLDELTDEEDTQPDETLPVRFAEVYIYMDRDEDGIAELRLFRCVGDSFEIVPDEDGSVDGEIVDERPFAIFCPDPEPHTMVGLSTADSAMDIQLINSNIVRGMLDSLNLSLNPQTEVVDGQVNMKDLMNPEIGGVVRVRQPGMLREVRHDFIGAQAFPMLEHFKEILENRTGQSKAAQGLNPDALQSSTAAAVAATITAAQQQIEMIARVFAETGMKQLFKGLLKSVIRHQDRARVVRLRNQFTVVDPRTWNASMDVRVNIALGQGLTQEKLQSLGLILAEQKEQMQAGSPLVSRVEFRATLGRFVELIGWPNSAEFFKPWSEQDEQQAQQAAAAQEPPPDPTAMLIQVEQAKLQAQQATDQAELALKREEMLLKDDRERDKIASDAALREREIEAKYGVEIEDRRLRADIERARAAMDADLQRRKAEEAAMLARRTAATAQPGGGGTQ